MFKSLKSVFAMVNDKVSDIGEVTGLKLNDVGRIAFKTSTPLAYDEYRKNRQTGGFIIIDPATNATVAAGMMRPPPRELPVPDFVDYAI